jgi:phosphate transport system substrate-binding protein
MKPNSAILAVALASIALGGAAEARDQIRIVGSSTVYPFSTAVAEQFGRAGKFKTPVVESTGTGGGIKLFCAGVGDTHPDIANASRRITAAEFADCTKAGITVTEVKIGYDGIVVANAKTAGQLKVTVPQLFLALAKEVAVGGKKVPNPYKQWADIDPSLPKTKIEVLGPPPTSGTRDAFVELVMTPGCATAPGIKDAGIAGAACAAIREDGAYVEAGENDNLIVQKLVANKDAFGVFGYSFLDQNSDKLQGATINGVAPRFEDIAAGKYPVSRPLYFYVKKDHLATVPGIAEFIGEFTNEKAIGEDGYLSAKGLIPMPAAERKAVRDSATSLSKLAM